VQFFNDNFKIYIIKLSNILCNILKIDGPSSSRLGINNNLLGIDIELQFYSDISIVYTQLQGTFYTYNVQHIT